MRTYQSTRDARERLASDSPELDEKKQMNLKGLPQRVKDEIVDFAAKEAVSNGIFVASTVTFWKLMGQPSLADIEAMWKGEKPLPKAPDVNALPRAKPVSVISPSAAIIDDLVKLTKIAQDAETLPDGRTKSAIRKKTQLILGQIGPEEAPPLPPLRPRGKPGVRGKPELVAIAAPEDHPDDAED
jgi:hypothetical protein